MAHIHTGAGQHDLTVSAFIVRTGDGEPRVLLHRHKTLGIPLQPGGHVELDETPAAALAHELLEETGYEASAVTLLQPPERVRSLSGARLQPQPVCVNTHRIGALDHWHTDLAYAAIVAADPVRPPAAGESRELFWLTLAEMRAAGVPQNAVEIAEFVVAVCLPGWDRVAMTAFAG